MSSGRTGARELSDNLKFITELGRQLLFTVHPKKVASCVAESLCRELKAEVCAIAVELEHAGLVSAAFLPNSKTRATGFLQKEKFKKWLSVLPPQISTCSDDESKFLLRGKFLAREYVSPLHIDGKVKGALIVGFRRKTECDESARRLADAAAQMAAMSVNLSAHYETALDASISSAKEEHRKFTETVLDALPVSIYVIDREYRIVTWNHHREIGEQGIARESVIGRSVFEVLNRYPQKRLRQEFDRAFRTGKIERIEQRTTDDRGVTKHWLISKIPMRDRATGEVTHVITVGEDISVRVEAMHAIGRAEKLAAVGRLAAGVVHEINNPLATISACAEALETRVSEGGFADSPDAEDLSEYLGLIRNEAFRCKTITNGLLNFSRARAGNRMPLDVNGVVSSSARLLAHQKRVEGIEIRLESEADLPLINGDEGQIQQAIIALATNAMDAMPAGGTLTFRTAHRNGRVVLEVVDTGGGIAPENLSKIFEPFFTTKEIGAGTGLGLAVCYGVVTEHEARIAVRSNPGVGSTFTIYFPIHKDKF